MAEKDKKPLLIPALVRMKCPNCRRGDIFTQSTFPLKGNLHLHEHCPHCGMKMVKESNNGFGINYVLTVLTIILNILWYWPIFGISYMDNSIFYFLATSVTVTILLQPWYLRLSRTLFLYFSVGYRSKPFLK
jgi:uncharacterized protein (DUF983 family)